MSGKLLFAPSEMNLPVVQRTCVLGRSGVRKSTILRQIAGVDTGGEFTGSIIASDARTLMENREVALLDVPFSALDASTRADIQNLATTKNGGNFRVKQTD